MMNRGYVENTVFDATRGQHERSASLDSASKAKTVEVSKSLEKGSDRMFGPKSKRH